MAKLKEKGYLVEYPQELHSRELPFSGAALHNGERRPGGGVRELKKQGPSI
jgi:hypothetical protein